MRGRNILCISAFIPVHGRASVILAAGGGGLTLELDRIGTPGRLSVSAVYLMRVHIRRDTAIYSTGCRMPLRSGVRRVTGSAHRESRGRSGHSGLGRGPKAALGATGARQARWTSSDLLPAIYAGLGVDADSVSEECG
jgi:hypothetical protein